MPSFSLLSLYQRLTLTLVLVFCLMLGVVLWWSDKLHKQTNLVTEQKLHLGLAEHLVHDNPALASGNYDKDALKSLFHVLMLLGANFEFYYTDADGKILAYSADPNKIKRERIDVQPINLLINNAKPLPILGDDPRNKHKQKIFSAAPIYNATEQLTGYLYVIIGGEKQDSIMSMVKSDGQLSKMSVIVLLSFAFLLISLMMLFHYFTKPLRQLTQEMQYINSNQTHLLSFEAANKSVLEQPITVNNDEVGILKHTFYQMVNQIQTQMTQIQELDQYRRTLLADLSHDLRTPLSNLQGYIEAIALQNDADDSATQVMDEQQRQAFLQIALKNAKNLKHLVDQIFDLANLESGQVAIHKECFPIGELLWDIKAKFALNAEEKDLSIVVEPAECNYLVFTDIAKVERVLSNLLENAIRHTPKNGQITLQVGLLPAKADMVKVSVIDNGIGIDKTEIGYIFDARYRANNSMEDKKSHAGLGLAISKKLMQLLDSNLQVESDLGKGTSFSFDLAMHTQAA